MSIWECPQLFPTVCFLPRFFFFFFSPNMLHSKFFWLYLYFLALFLCHNINFSEESGVIVIEHLTF